MLVCVFNFDLFEFSTAILEKGLLFFVERDKSMLWMLVNQLFLTQAFFMLTDAAGVSENSEAFVCLVEDASGKGTLIYI